MIHTFVRLKARCFFAVAVLCLMHVLASAAEQQVPGQRLALDSGWRFHLGDIPMPEIKGHGPSYNNAKAGRAWGAAAPDYDDSAWKRLDLPHDWVVEGPFDPKENIAQGYRPRGVAWYRRYVQLDEADRGRHLELQFDGISTHATIWVNGLLVHRNWCGYTPAYVDITPIATYGDQLNSIVVRVDANPMEGWWYEGGGIYRHVWLAKRAPVHLVTDGVYANPVRAASGDWTVPVEATLANIGQATASVVVRAELLDPEGRVVVQGQANAEVAPLGQSTVQVPLAVAQPRIWSLDTPTLYTTRVSVLGGGRPVDEARVTTGFRTIRFDANLGFFLNDKPVKIKGTCNHQDHAGVGVAVPDALWEYRVRRLKEMGSNAYRAAHNPPAREFLEACDRLGMLVMDENRNFNHTPEYLGQLQLLVRRDRNHPSVILWSVFNEEPMQGTEQGREMVRRMVAEVRRWDTTRPVTAAMNGGMNNPHGVFEAVDVMGFNYCHSSYDSFHARFPMLPILSSEDTSAFMTRGEFETDPARNVISSYDTEFASWGRSHREAWKLIADRPFLAGGFVWTGFDYRGEPQRLSWPSVSSVFGIMDLCGFPKTAYHIHQAQWIEDRPVLELAPHWNWGGREGQPIKVIAMTNADTVALHLNGVPLGEKTVPRLDYAEWSVPYSPGRLEAVAFRSGREVVRTVVETTGEAVALQLLPDRSTLAGDGRDAMPITVRAVDAQGRVVPGAAPLVTLAVQGPGKSLGHGNGDHNCHDPEQGPTRRLFHGLAQVIVQSQAGSGDFLVSASAPGLQSAVARIPVLPAPPIAAQAAADPLFQVGAWRMAPPSPTQPDPLQAMSQADMNSWASIRPGTCQTAAAGQWVLYRSTFTPWRSLQLEGGTILLRQIAGAGSVWLDGVKVAELRGGADQDLSVEVPPGTEPRTLTLLLQTGESKRVGLGASVVMQARMAKP